MEQNKFEKIGGIEEGVIDNSDIVVNKESGLAVVVIKPDAFKNRDQIIKRLEGSGLYVVKTVDKRLPDGFVIGSMYKDLSSGLQEETLKHFNTGPSEIVLLKGGDDLIKQITSVTGESTNPSECDEESIRYLFGEHFSRETESGDEYYRNAVHRAKDGEEQKGDLDKFEHLL